MGGDNIGVSFSECTVIVNLAQGPWLLPPGLQKRWKPLTWSRIEAECLVPQLYTVVQVKAYHI